MKNSDEFQDLEELLEDEGDADADDASTGADDGRRRIFTDKLDPKVSGLHQSFKSGDLVLNPTFQRRKVWDDARSSRLIESALLEVPLRRAQPRPYKFGLIGGEQHLTRCFSRRRTAALLLERLEAAIVR